MDVFRFNYSEIAIKNIINNLLNDATINSNSTIISFGTGLNIISLSKYLFDKNIKLILVIPDDLDINIINELELYQADIIKAPTKYGYLELCDLAKDISLEIENSYFLNLLEVSLSYKIFLPYLKEINNYDNIIIPIGSGILIRSIAMYLKISKEANIIGLTIKNKYDFKLSNITNDMVDSLELLDEFDRDYLNNKYPNSIIILGENYENIKI